MKAASALDELIDALRCLPSVGPRSAQRMAYHLLQHDQDGAQRLAAALGRASAASADAAGATPSPKRSSAGFAPRRSATRGCCAWWKCPPIWR